MILVLSTVSVVWRKHRQSTKNAERWTFRSIIPRYFHSKEVIFACKELLIIMVMRVGRLLQVCNFLYAPVYALRPCVLFWWHWRQLEPSLTVSLPYGKIFNHLSTRVAHWSSRRLHHRVSIHWWCMMNISEVEDDLVTPTSPWSCL